MQAQAIRQVVSAEALTSLFSLPPNFSGHRVEVVMRPIDYDMVPQTTVSTASHMSEPNIDRFLSGAVDWSEATQEELEAGYRAEAADTEHEQEAHEWIEGLTNGIIDYER
jgi:hypothetical protein